MHFPKRPTLVVDIHTHLHIHTRELLGSSLAALAHAALARKRLQRALTPRSGESDRVPGLARVLVLGLLVALVGVRLLGRSLRINVHAGVCREKESLLAFVRVSRFTWKVEAGQRRTARHRRR
jgi:hypothetical protein